ncbi:unnamed protein product [Discosporangium mesarthrocarpum]
MHSGHAKRRPRPSLRPLAASALLVLQTSSVSFCFVVPVPLTSSWQSRRARVEPHRVILDASLENETPNERVGVVGSSISSGSASFTGEAWFGAKGGLGALDEVVFLEEGRVMRSMTEGDIDGVIALAFEEFVNTDANQQQSIKQDLWAREGLDDSRDRDMMLLGLAEEEGGFRKDDVDRFVDMLEVAWLRNIVRWGFFFRVTIGKSGRDHRVFCITEREGGGDSRALVGVAEVSLQAPNGCPATAFPLPLWLKQVFGWPLQAKPYISNVLINPSCRRRGLAKKLMQHCEDQARRWGYEEVRDTLVSGPCRRFHGVFLRVSRVSRKSQVYLHVDLSYLPALQMYSKLGYKAVENLPSSKIREHPQLHFMRKSLY